MANKRIGLPYNLESGSTYGLLLMGFPNGFPRGYVTFEIGDTPRRITGVQKVVQTFLYNLLSTRGSDPIRFSSGTTLPDFIYSGNVTSDELELQTIVSTAVRDAETQTRRILASSNNDLTSQLQSAEVLFINTADQNMTIGLRIVTRAGQQASIAIPFPQTDLAINAT